MSAHPRYYRINAQLNGSGHVSYTITVTDAGRTTSDSDTARGGHTIASPQICATFDDRWEACG